MPARADASAEAIARAGTRAEAKTEPLRFSCVVAVPLAPTYGRG